MNYIFFKGIDIQLEDGNDLQLGPEDEHDVRMLCIDAPEIQEPIDDMGYLEQEDSSDPDDFPHDQRSAAGDPAGQEVDDDPPGDQRSAAGDPAGQEVDDDPDNVDDDPDNVDDDPDDVDDDPEDDDPPGDDDPDDGNDCI